MIFPFEIDRQRSDINDRWTNREKTKESRFDEQMAGRLASVLIIRTAPQTAALWTRTTAVKSAICYESDLKFCGPSQVDEICSGSRCKCAELASSSGETESIPSDAVHQPYQHKIH